MARRTGTCTGQYGDRYNLYLDYNLNSQSITHNRSNISLRMWAQSTSTAYHAYNLNKVNSYAVKIDGVNKSSGKKAMDFRNRAVVELGNWTGNVYHKEDGTKTIKISGNFSIIGTSSLSGGSVPSYSWVLPTIPRTSKPTLSNSNPNLGSTEITINTNRASSSFTHTLRYKFGNDSGTIAENVRVNYKWTPSASLINQIPNSTSRKGTIYCDTYSGKTKIGTENISFTGRVPANILPSLDTITHSENNMDVETKVGKYVQTRSKLNLSIVGAKGTYGSTIKSYSIIFDNKTYSGSNIVTDNISGSGNLAITGKVTDSRGRSARKTITVDVIPYTPPVITVFEIERSDVNGNADFTGIYSKVIRAGNISSLVVDNIQKNSLTYRIRVKQRGDQSWSTAVEETLSGSAATGDPLMITGSEILGTFPIISSYDFRFEISDIFNTVFTLGVLPTGEVPMAWDRHGIGIGKIREQGRLDVLGDIFSNGINITDSSIEMMGETIYGNYICWNNGLQVCWLFKLAWANTLANIVYGEIFRGESFTWTYPKGFSKNPVVTGLASGSHWIVAYAAQGRDNRNSMTLRTHRGTISNVDPDIWVAAIGWWKTPEDPAEWSEE